MNKIYKDLDKLDEKLRKQGSFDLNRKPCFAEVSISECSALVEKNCYECKFYKPVENQVDVIIKEIQSHRDFLSKQSLKTLVGQAKAGDLIGAMKGLTKIKRMRGI